MSALKYKGSVVHQDIDKAAEVLHKHSALELTQDEFDPLVEHVATIGPDNFAKSALASTLSIHDTLGAVLTLEAAANPGENATEEQIAAAPSAAAAAALLRERFDLRKKEVAP